VYVLNPFSTALNFFLFNFIIFTFFNSIGIIVGQRIQLCLGKCPSTVEKEFIV